MPCPFIWVILPAHFTSLLFNLRLKWDSFIYTEFQGTIHWHISHFKSLVQPWYSLWMVLLWLFFLFSYCVYFWLLIERKPAPGRWHPCLSLSSLCFQYPEQKHRNYAAKLPSNLSCSNTFHSLQHFPLNHIIYFFHEIWSCDMRIFLHFSTFLLHLK